MRDKLLNLSRAKKRVISLLIDTGFIWLSLYLAFFIRYGIEDIQINIILFFQISIMAPVIVLPFYIRHGLYRAVLRYMGSEVFLTILRATVYAVLGLMLACFLIGLKMPRSVPFLFGGLMVLFVTSSRFAIKYWLAGYRLQDMLLDTFEIPYKPKLT